MLHMFRVPSRPTYIVLRDLLESSPTNTFHKNEDTHLLRSQASSHEAQHKLRVVWGFGSESKNVPRVPFALTSRTSKWVGLEQSMLVRSTSCQSGRLGSLPMVPVLPAPLGPCGVLRS